MKVDFYLRFYTHPGQSILLTGNISELGNGDATAALPLEYVNEEFWHGSVVVEGTPSDPIHYHYVLKGADGTLIEESGDDKHIGTPPPGIGEVHVIDTWNYAGEYENVFFTAPFRKVLLPHHKAGKKGKAPASYTHT